MDVQIGSAEQPVKSGRNGCLMLFGIPFAAVGLGLLAFKVVPDVAEWQAMKAWQPVPAQVLVAELQEHRGDDSTTYEATGRYRYSYGGRDYESDRVALGSGADNLGDFQQDLAAQLQRAQGSGETVTAWVNPEQPAQAVINRELRLGQLAFFIAFGLVFAVVGIGVIAAGFFVRGGSTGVVDAAQPWRSRKEWASPEIRAGGKGTAVAAWFIALIWCGISGIATVAGYDEFVNKQNTAALLVLLFDVVGIGLLYWAIHATLAARRFGELVLRLDPHPGSIGGDVGGMIDIPVAHSDQRAVAMTLTCMHVYTRRSGKNSETRRDALWSDTRYFFGEPTMDGKSRVHFAFAVPDGLPVSTAADNDYHEWTLSLACELPGVDLSRSFEIPVFATAAKTRLLSRVRESQEESLAHLETLMNLQQIAGGVSMDYRAGRHWQGGLGIILFGLVFGAVPVFMFYVDDMAGFAPVMFGVIFGLVALACVAGGLWMLGNRLQVAIDETGLRLQRHLFGVPVQTLTVPRHDLAGIHAVRAGSATSGSKVTVYYSLQLKLNDGSLHGIGDGFRGYGEAGRAAEAIAAFTRLDFLGEADKGAAFAARKAAFLAKHGGKTP